MKVLALFSLLMAVVTSYPVIKTWTLRELSEAIEKSTADPDMMPYLEDALNLILLALYTEVNVDVFMIRVPSPSGAPTWTVDELTEALADPNTKPEYMQSLRQAYDTLMVKNKTGNIQESAEVRVPAIDISAWTMSDITEALKSPSTKSEIIPYLETARADLNEAIENGEKRDATGVITAPENFEEALHSIKI